MMEAQNKELRLEWTVHVEYKVVLAQLEERLKRSLKPGEVIKAMSLIETPDTRILEQLDDMRAILKEATIERVLRELEA